MAQAADTCTVSVAGRLAAVHVGELLRVCNTAAGILRIDLTDLLAVDSAGADALRRLTDDGAEIFGMSQYLGHRLGIGQKTPP